MNAFRWYFAEVASPRQAFQRLYEYYAMQEPTRRLDVALALQDMIFKSYATHDVHLIAYPRVSLLGSTVHAAAVADQQAIRAAITAATPRLYFVPTRMVINGALDLRIDG